MNFLEFEGTLGQGASSVNLSGYDTAIPALREANEGQMVFGVRPEHVRLTTDGGYRAEVLATEYLGTTQIITLNTQNGEIKARIGSDKAVNVGETVGLEFNDRTITVFDKGSGRALQNCWKRLPVPIWSTFCGTCPWG